jgi:hypothetical protein
VEARRKRRCCRGSGWATCGTVRLAAVLQLSLPHAYDAPHSDGGGCHEAEPSRGTNARRITSRGQHQAERSDQEHRRTPRETIHVTAATTAPHCWTIVPAIRQWLGPRSEVLIRPVALLCGPRLEAERTNFFAAEEGRAGELRVSVVISLCQVSGAGCGSLPRHADQHLQRPRAPADAPDAPSGERCIGHQPRDHVPSTSPASSSSELK